MLRFIKLFSKKKVTVENILTKRDSILSQIETDIVERKTRWENNEIVFEKYDNDYKELVQLLESKKITFDEYHVRSKRLTKELQTNS